MKDEKITFKVTKETKEQLKQIALRRDITISQLIREIIKEYLEEK